MYQFVDRPVTTLDKGCRFLMWSMRSWILISQHGECPARSLAPAFAQWKMIGGLQPFLRMMLGLNGDALEKISFCSLNCNRISEHEAILLSLFVNLAQDRRMQVRDTLALLISEDGIGDMLGSMSAVSAALSEATIPPGLPAANEV